MLSGGAWRKERQAHKIAWQVKAPATKPYDLNLVLGTHTVEGEN